MVNVGIEMRTNIEHERASQIAIKLFPTLGIFDNYMGIFIGLYKFEANIWNKWS